MSEYKFWSTEHDGHIATLTLHGCDAINSLNLDVLHELREISGDLHKQQDVWAVIVQGEGKHFSGGIDLNVIQELIRRSAAENRAFMADFQDCLVTFESLPKATIAKLRGLCFGGGLILALCCDFRIASERAVFCQPEIKLGLAIIGTQRITRVVGVEAAKELILLGKRFKAQEALNYRLVHQVVKPEDLDASVLTMARKFERLPPRSVGISKRIIDESHLRTMQECHEFEVEVMAELLETEDIKEAVASHIEKRKPEFTGG